jgi:hypothetical protein
MRIFNFNGIQINSLIKITCFDKIDSKIYFLMKWLYVKKPMKKIDFKNDFQNKLKKVGKKVSSSKFHIYIYKIILSYL